MPRGVLYTFFLSIKTFPQIIHVCQVKIRNTKYDHRFLKEFYIKMRSWCLMGSNFNLCLWITFLLAGFFSLSKIKSCFTEQFIE